MMCVREDSSITRPVAITVMLITLHLDASNSVCSHLHTQTSYICHANILQRQQCIGEAELHIQSHNTDIHRQCTKTNSKGHINAETHKTKEAFLFVILSTSRCNGNAEACLDQLILRLQCLSVVQVTVFFCQDISPIDYCYSFYYLFLYIEDMTHLGEQTD